MLSDQVVISVSNAIILTIPSTLIAIGGLIVAIRNGGKTKEVKTLVNGRMEEFLKTVKELSHREGKEAGIKEVVENGLAQTVSVNVQSQSTQRSINFLAQKTSEESIIRDKESGHILCRRHHLDPEVLDALNDPTKIVE